MIEKTCPECHAEFYENPQIPYLICPHCGAKLNEYSSEDASDGELQTILNHKWDVVKPSEGVVDYDNLPF